MDIPGGSVVKNPPAHAGGPALPSGLERYPGEGIGSPLQYSHLENLMDRRAWWSVIHGVPKSQMWLSN